MWVTVLPLQEIDSNLINGLTSEEFLRYQELIYSKKGNHLRLLYSAVIMGKYPFPKESYDMNQS